MNDEPKKFTAVTLVRWRWPLMVGALFLGIFGYIYFAQHWGPGPNTVDPIV